VTPYFAGLMDRHNRECPIRRQVIPSMDELHTAPGEREDPLGEEADSPVPGLTHRYPDRVLLLVTNQCFVYCRHCNRRRKVGGEPGTVNGPMLDAAIDYIARTPAVEDVLVSGGDPLFLPTDVLETILSRLRAIPHVKTIRIGTRALSVLPMRITDGLCAALRQFHPLYINTQFNHPAELTRESRRALAALADAGIPLGNQTVLLKGVNDCPLILRRLFLSLIENRVRPYYLFQCDQVPGTARFRTPVSRGIEIMESLIGHIPGYAVPTFAVDPPDGAGKIPLAPDYVVSRSPSALVLRNYEGVFSRYAESPEVTSACPAGCALCEGPPPNGGRRGADTGIAALLSPDGPDAMAPVQTDRHRRRSR